jgi:hypothetical protein
MNQWIPSPRSAIPEHRKPEEMDSWELIAMFRHARALLGFGPNVQLTRALVNFMAAAHHELERRGECNDEYLLGALAPTRRLVIEAVHEP